MRLGKHDLRGGGASARGYTGSSRILFLVRVHSFCRSMQESNPGPAGDRPIMVGTGGPSARPRRTRKVAVRFTAAGAPAFGGDGGVGDRGNQTWEAFLGRIMH